MSDDYKMNHWVRSLEQAGLMDEVEGAWYLPGEPKDGSTIRVEERRGEPEGPKNEKTPYARLIESGGSSATVRSSISAKIAADAAELQNDESPVHVGNPAPTKAPPTPLGGVVEELTLAEQTWFTDEDDPDESPRHSPPKPRKRNDSGLEILAEELDDNGLVVEMQELYDMGNYSGALKLAEHILRTEPEDTVAKRIRDNSKETLLHMYEAKFGSFERTPRLAIDTHEVIWHKLDPPTGFVLSRIDGTVTFEDIIDICGLGRYETCRILNHLLQEGIIK